MSNWRKTFGEDYAVPAWAEQSAHDVSWGNEACPHFEASAGEFPRILTVSLWVEHPNPTQRDSGNPHRFSISLDIFNMTAELESKARELAASGTGAFPLLFTPDGESCWTGDDEDEAQRIFRATLATARTL